MSGEEAQPFVSIVVPCLNEEDSIVPCLTSIVSQDYPTTRMEILIADGGSTDRTLEAIEQFMDSHRDVAIRVVDNPDRIQAAGCNRAILASKGEIIVRMDAHAYYRTDYVTSCVSALATSGAELVGGAQRPAWRTPFQRAMAAALDSPLAVGGAAYRSPLRDGFVDTVWLGAFRKSALQKVGLFDPRAATNEDAELNYRISRAGGRIYLSREIVAHYFPRNSIRALARQYFRYGIGRARTTLKHRRLQSWRPLAPLGLVLLLSSLGLAAIASAAAESALLLVISSYLLLVFIEGARMSLRYGMSLMPDVMVILPTIHLAWGTGFLTGLLRYLVKPDWSDTPVGLSPR